ncbi:MAG: hypothetical protein NTW56_09060 [Alphaproteobacteria bacterium]|nr:hypothetical protein [Alphaproteobacteria bacterium]
MIPHEPILAAIDVVGMVAFAISDALAAVAGLGGCAVRNVLPGLALSCAGTARLAAARSPRAGQVE